LIEWWREVLPGQGRCGRGAGSLAFRPQQPVTAAADRDVPRRRYVLIDQEMVYAPRQGNDRLLLGN